MLAANGEVITHFYKENRAPVASDQIAEIMKQALVAIEDARFYEHGGSTSRAPCARWSPTWRRARCEAAPRSPSSWSSRPSCSSAAGSEEARTAATEQTLGRKLREVRLALALEDTYSKDELLTRYLNIVYFGQNAYGIQPAARAFFGVDASALTLTQAALLAGLVQSPADDDPFTNPEARPSGATRCSPGWPRRATSRRRRRPRRRPPCSASRPPRRRAAAASRPASGPTSATSCSST